MYVDKAKSKSVLFAYDIHPRFGEKTFPVKLQGLDPNKKYKVQEINLMPARNRPWLPTEVPSAEIS